MLDTPERQTEAAPLLLGTKLYVPRARPTLLSRPQLLARLDAALHRSVTLISAPTGSGKTALLTDWRSRQDRLRSPHLPRDDQRTIAWFSLDRGDDDVVQFLRYLVAACQALVPSAGAALLALLGGGLGHLPPTPALMTPLINDLAQGARAASWCLTTTMSCRTPGSTMRSPS